MLAGRWLTLRIAIATDRPAPPVAAPPGTGHKRSSGPRVHRSKFTGHSRRSLVSVEFPHQISSTLDPTLSTSIYRIMNERVIRKQVSVYCQEISHFNLVTPKVMSLNRINISHSNSVTTSWSNFWMKNVSSVCVCTL